MIRLAALFALAIVVGALAPTYIVGLLSLVLAYASASLAQNLLSGWADVPSLGNVAFFATGAYAAGSLLSIGHLPLVLAAAGGVCAAAVLGAAVGLPALRISGMHLAIVTVALVFAGQEVMGAWDASHSQNGVSVAGPGWLLDERGLYLSAVILTTLGYLLVARLLQSSGGRAIQALSDGRSAAVASGINPVRYHLATFVFSGALTGLAGVVYLYYAHTVTPAGFPLDLSLAFLTMMILGGSRSLPGSLLGALIIGLLPEALSHLPAHVGSIDVSASASALYAILLLLTLRLAPGGLWPGIASVARRLPGR